MVSLSRRLFTDTPESPYLGWRHAVKESIKLHEQRKNLAHLSENITGAEVEKREVAMEQDRLKDCFELEMWLVGLCICASVTLMCFEKVCDPNLQFS